MQRYFTSYTSTVKPVKPLVFSTENDHERQGTLQRRGKIKITLKELHTTDFIKLRYEVGDHFTVQMIFSRLRSAISTTKATKP